MGAAGDILGGGRGGTAPRALARLPCTVNGERAGGERSSGWERRRRRLRPLRLPSPPPGPGSAGRQRGGAGPRRQRQPSGGRERASERAPEEPAAGPR